MDDGELVIHAIKQNPVSWRSGQPPGSVSQTITVVNPETEEKILVMHQYVLPNGKIGGSGKPEPKMLCEGGVIYKAFGP